MEDNSVVEDPKQNENASGRSIIVTSLVLATEKNPPSTQEVG